MSEPSDLTNRLNAHAFAIERTATSDHDREVVAVMREAAEELEPGSVAKFTAVIRQATEGENDHDRDARHAGR